MCAKKHERSFDQLVERYPVGKVAKMVDVETHTIRFWQSNFPHIQYTEGPGKRKYYDIEAIEQFKEIKRLMYVRGIKIFGIKQMVYRSKIREKKLPRSNLLTTSDDAQVELFATGENKTAANNNETTAQDERTGLFPQCANASELDSTQASLDNDVHSSHSATNNEATDEHDADDGRAFCSPLFPEANTHSQYYPPQDDINANNHNKVDHKHARPAHPSLRIRIIHHIEELEKALDI